MAYNSALEELPYPKQQLSKKSVITEAFSEVLPGKLIERLKAITEEDGEPTGIAEIRMLSGSSNEVMHLNMNDGRSLMLKRAPYDWAGPRFQNARRASALIRKKSSLVAPKHVQLSENIGEMPMMAYWFISLPTLENLWPRLSSDQQINALHSMGSMLEKMHRVKVSGYGQLNGDDCYDSVSAYMEDDLRNRLRSAVWTTWPEALPLIDRLGHMARYLPEAEEKATLIHNDLHLDNILCRVEDGNVECVGLLDFEAAQGGRPESDLASSMVLHDPLFAEESSQIQWVEDFDRHLLEGYGSNINLFLLQFFEIYHLLNLGYFSALNGDEFHAGQVAEVAGKKLKSI